MIFISIIEEANISYCEENILNFLLLMGGEERNKAQKNVLEMAEKNTSVSLMQWDNANLPFEIWINTIRKRY